MRAVHFDIKTKYQLGLSYEKYDKLICFLSFLTILVIYVR